MSEWISVEDRLPEQVIDVLFVGYYDCIETGIVGLGSIRRTSTGFCFVDDTNTDNWGDSECVYDVKHWMPLPLPPKADNTTKGE